jgi:DUF4097 and DUF4098 domain-containing protein YvlB
VKHSIHWILAGSLALAAGMAAPGAATQTSGSTQDRDWCDDANDRGRDDDEHFCEVRELTPGRLSSLDGSTANGSIRVTGGSRQDVIIRARVTTRAASADDARDLAKQVRVSVENGRLTSDGPSTRGRRQWQVSYRIETPRTIDLMLESSNGSVDLTGVTGRIRANSSNGSVRIADLGGDVRLTTSNGSLNVVLNGTTWNGAGLEAVTSNGSVRLDVPADYNAHLIASTANGSLDVDFPVTVQGRITSHRSPRIDAPIGKGGPTLRVQSSNGSVNVRRR